MQQLKYNILEELGGIMWQCMLPELGCMCQLGMDIRQSLYSSSQLCMNALVCMASLPFLAGICSRVYNF